MVKYLILARFKGESPTPPSELLEGASPSLWSDIAACDQTLLVCQFADREDADERLKQHFTASTPAADLQSPDIRGVDISERNGSGLADMDGKFLSVISFHASPGMGPAVGDELSQTLQSLAMMPGYMGYIRGSNAALDEELWALVLWNSKPPTPQDSSGISHACYSRIE